MTLPKPKPPATVAKDIARGAALRYMAAQGGAMAHADEITEAVNTAALAAGLPERTGRAVVVTVLYRLRAVAKVRNQGRGMWTITPEGIAEIARLDYAAAAAGGPPPPTYTPGTRRAFTEGDDGPACTAANRALLTRNLPRPAMTTADLHPRLERAECHALREIPSRRGNYLQYRDGRRTTLDGVEVEVVA